MSGIISNLPELRWRGLRAPCESAPIDFSHSQAKHPYPYIDVANHDWVGRDSLQIKVRLFFVNTIEQDSFPDLWEAWQEALFDGNSGELIHPVLGTMRAVVLSGSISLVAQNREGITLDVVFEETRDDLEEAIAFDAISASPEAIAKAADDALAALDIPMPPTLPPTVSLLDSFNKIKGDLFSLSASVNGAINQLAGVATSLIGTVESLNDASAWPALSNLVSFWGTLQDLKDRAAKLVIRPTGKRITSSDTTIDAIAQSTGNTVIDIMGLNLALLRSPTVPKNTSYTFYS